MDVCYQAQVTSDHFHDLAVNQQRYDLAPAPPVKTDAAGNALCIDCDIDITERRRVVPSAQRCTECQQDHNKRERHHG